MSEHPAPQDRDLTSQIGPVAIDWPRTAGYYTAIVLAVAFEAIEPPVGLFIAAVPFLKMLNRPRSSAPLRLLGQFFDGASNPVGGDAPATITLLDRGDASTRQTTGLLAEARRIADRMKSPTPAPSNGHVGR